MRNPFPTLILTLVAASGAPAAAAQCSSSEATFMSCTFNNGAKAVDVCLHEHNVTYAFGPTGKTPELALSVPIMDADYTPWPGISTVWEEMAFHVDDISYVVSAGVTRSYPEDENAEIQADIWGNIGVYRDYDRAGSAQTLATLECDKGSVEFQWGTAFSDAKQALGQCWSPENHAWQACE